MRDEFSHSVFCGAFFFFLELHIVSVCLERRYNDNRFSFVFGSCVSNRCFLALRIRGKRLAVGANLELPDMRHRLVDGLVIQSFRVAQIVLIVEFDALILWVDLFHTCILFRSVK